MPGLNVLIVSCYDLFPMNNGGLIRISRLAQGLAMSAGISRVTLAYPTFRTESASDELENITLYPVVLPAQERSRLKRLAMGMVRGVPPFATGTFYRIYEKALAELLERQHFDRVQLEQTAAAAYLHAVHSGTEAPIIFDLHDIETYRIRTMPLPRSRQSIAGRVFQALDRLLVQHWETRFLRMAAGVCVVSAQEKDRLLALVPLRNDRVGVISNGISPQAEAWRPGGETLTMIGSLYYDPNFEAAQWVTKEVMPLVWKRRPQAQLIIAGAASPGLNVTPLLADKRIEVRLNVPDILEVYRYATIALIGVQTGGGAALKLLEALMLGVPVVSTIFGIRGYLPAPPCLIGDTAATMAAQIVGLLDDPERQKQLSQQGRVFAQEDYTWQKIGGGLAEFHMSLTTQ